MNWVPVISGVSGTVLVAALALTVIGALAYRRTKRPRFLVVTLAFGVLLLRASWTLYAMYAGMSWESIFGLASCGDAAMLALLYFAAVR